LLGFDQDLIDQIRDFREAALDANENALLARAVRQFIERYIRDNAGVRREYLAVRKRRGKRD
jgi:hypothetical protein